MLSINESKGKLTSSEHNKSEKEKFIDESSTCYNFANNCAGLILQGADRSFRQPQNPSSSIGKGIGRGWSGIIPTYHELMHKLKSDMTY
jgi:superfamily II RNA helicase